MGNNFSVVQNERDEAEFRRLADAVEVAERYARSGLSNDLEAGLAVGSYNPFTGVFQRPQHGPALNDTFRDARRRTTLPSYSAGEAVPVVVQPVIPPPVTPSAACMPGYVSTAPVPAPAPRTLIIQHPRSLSPVSYHEWEERHRIADAGETPRLSRSHSWCSSYAHISSGRGRIRSYSPHRSSRSPLRRGEVLARHTEPPIIIQPPVYPYPEHVPVIVQAPDSWPSTCEELGPPVVVRVPSRRSSRSHSHSPKTRAYDRYTHSRHPTVINRTHSYSRSRSPPIIIQPPQQAPYPMLRQPPAARPTVTPQTSEPSPCIIPCGTRSHRSQSPAYGRQSRSRSRSPVIVHVVSRRPSYSRSRSHSPVSRRCPEPVSPPVQCIDTLPCSLRISPPRRSRSSSPARSPVVVVRSRSRRGRSPSPRSRSPSVSVRHSLCSRRSPSRSATPVLYVPGPEGQPITIRVPTPSVRMSRSRSPRAFRCGYRSSFREVHSVSRSPMRRRPGRSPYRVPADAPENSETGRLCKALESWEKAARELLEAQQSNLQQSRVHDERMRAYDERMLTYDHHMLTLLRSVHRETGLPDIAPFSSEIALRTRTDIHAEQVTEKDVDRKVDYGVPTYPNIPYAAGLALASPTAYTCIDKWQPAWLVFPLKAFRGSDYTFIRIQPHWDDEALLRELARTYDHLRTFWRKWFSLRNVSSITMVLADHSFVYPQRVGPARVSPAKNMRLRYLLHHPHSMKGRHEFMQVLTARTDLGIEFVERFQLSRMAIAILLPVVFSAILGVLYSALTGDVSSAFTISGYMTSAYSVCLVLVGVLNLVEF